MTSMRPPPAACNNGHLPSRCSSPGCLVSVTLGSCDTATPEPEFFFFSFIKTRPLKPPTPEVTMEPCEPHHRAKIGFQPQFGCQKPLRILTRVLRCVETISRSPTLFFTSVIVLSMIKKVLESSWGGVNLHCQNYRAGMGNLNAAMVWDVIFHMWYFESRRNNLNKFMTKMLF